VEQNSELRGLSPKAKIVPTFVDIGCRVVRAADP
jgi:hypothetical protein